MGSTGIAHVLILQWLQITKRSLILLHEDNNAPMVSQSKRKKVPRAIVESEHLCVLVKAYYEHFSKYSQN
jgi:hypothetical protein